MWNIENGIDALICKTDIWMPREERRLDDLEDWDRCVHCCAQSGSLMRPTAQHKEVCLGLYGDLDAEESRKGTICVYTQPISTLLYSGN